MDRWWIDQVAAETVTKCQEMGPFQPSPLYDSMFLALERKRDRFDN